jgi:hypothetical protein
MFNHGTGQEQHKAFPAAKNMVPVNSLAVGTEVFFTIKTVFFGCLFRVICTKGFHKFQNFLRVIFAWIIQGARTRINRDSL